MAGHGQDERNLDPGSRVILRELRDLRAEIRADRQRSDAERRQADAAWREERQQAAATWREEREQSSARFQKMMREFRQDFVRREAATQRAFKDIRPVGLSPS